MSLRARLLVSFTALLIVVIAAVGVVASRSVRRVLVAQVDRELVEVASRGGPNPRGRLALRDELFARGVAVVVQGPRGATLASLPSGFADDPDPLPDVGGLPSDAGGFVVLPAEDGSFDYRALVARGPQGTVVVWAMPLRPVDAAVASLVRTLVVAGGTVLLIGLGATWWTVKAGLRPVDRMVATASAISAGDLSRRVEDDDPATELGRLGAAFNDMLAHIEQAVGSEREAQERLRRFVADASHELRTPLSTIAGYAELHRKGGLEGPGQADEALTRIERESARMRRLVEDLLLLARLDQAQPLERRRIDLAELVSDAVADHRALDPGRPITLQAGEPVWVTGDPERLAQVIGNLLTNARTHTPPGTPVQVEVSGRDGLAVLEVTDEGPGIPEAALERIFDRFYRVDPSRDRRSGGTGLGLAIASAIVSAHGGRIHASNVRGHGARIKVTLTGAEERNQVPAE